jgi:hypothetical protein
VPDEEQPEHAGAEDTPATSDGASEPGTEQEQPGEDGDIPASPWRTGTVRMLEGAEVLGVAFTGNRVNKSIGAQLAGQALTALDDLVTMLAAAKFGKVGKRGPATLPTGIGALRLSGIAWGSAAFYFTPGEGEAFQIPESGTVEPTSKITEVVDELMDLVEASPTDEVVDVARRHSDRVAAKYVQFLEVVVTDRVGLAWRTTKRDPVLPPTAAGRALAVLEQTDHIRIEDLQIEGILYEANARTRGFRLQRDDGLLVTGRFEEVLYDVVGDAWNHRVVADIRVRVERLARSGDERRTFELVGLRILGPAT